MKFKPINSEEQILDSCCFNIPLYMILTFSQIVAKGHFKYCIFEMYTHFFFFLSVQLRSTDIVKATNLSPRGMFTRKMEYSVIRIICKARLASHIAREVAESGL